MQIVEWIREISTGKLISEISINRRDEIGTLADSCRIMQQNLSHKSKIAKMISEGDFSERVIVENEKDEVAHSINQIADNYSRFTEENELQNWLKTGQNLLNEDIQGVQEPGEFSRKVVSRLCSHLEAQIGALYIADSAESVLKLSGSYAFNPRKKTNNIIPFGDGLGGQCAIGKEILSITDIPVGFFKIGAGIGECTPVNVTAVPVIHADELYAVIELGSVREFSSRELMFLQLTSDIIGTGLHAVLAREETQKLLKETQRQAAELSNQQEELRITNEELEEKTEALQYQKDTLKKKNDELDRAMNEIAVKADYLKKSNSYKSEFMANMSHELRTPLNSIIILSKLLGQNEDENLSEKETEFADTIHSSGSDLLYLINEILDLSKIEAGKMEIIKEKLSIKQLLSSLTRSFQQIADEKKLDFNLTIEEEVPVRINSDLKRVEQILKNLLSNSFKFTENGKVSLKVSLEEPGLIKFSVIDTGIGIPEEKQKLIFEAFQQADGTTARQYGGTGLGLSISLELSRLLGGELRMKSTEGRGAEFELYLPTVPIVDSQVEKNLSKKAPGRGKTDDSDEKIFREQNNLLRNKKILLVDDDMRNVFALSNVFERNEIEVVVGKNGKDAIDKLEAAENIDLILMDIMMPEMDGYEAMKIIRKKPEYKKLPIIALTAKAMKGDRNKCIEAGASDYLAKPVEVDKLLSMLRFWLHQ
jgi:two-component system chemotaxis sensor kinase CheA